MSRFHLVYIPDGIQMESLSNGLQCFSAGFHLENPMGYLPRLIQNDVLRPGIPISVTWRDVHRGVPQSRNWSMNMAIEIVDLPIENCDFP